MDWFSFSADWIYSILPLDPFIHYIEALNSEGIQQGLKWLNWFVPLGDFIDILRTWVLCVASYYVFTVVLRWLKVIE